MEPRTDEDRGLTFEQLQAKYDRRIFSFVWPYIQNRRVAEDLTRETFERAGQAFPAFKGECRTETWIVQIALNVCKEWYRAQDQASG